MSDSKTTQYASCVLITGGTVGLGYHCALDLAKQLPTTLIIVASRTDPNSSAATINSTLKQSNVQYMPMDLGSLASVRSFAAEWHKASLPPISALVLNAGVQLPSTVSYTPDGIEKHFGINHVAHALLFHLLAPCLTPSARIVVVSSGLHDPEQGKIWGIMPRYTTPDAVANPTGDALKYNGRERYATSKAANAIWTFALGRHLRGSSKTVVSFDPGLMFGTSLAREANAVVRMLGTYVLPRLTPLFRLLVSKNINTPGESGGNMAWLVTAKENEGKKEVYFEKRAEREASVQARDENMQEELWKWTLERVAADAGEKEKFGKVQ